MLKLLLILSLTAATALSAYDLKNYRIPTHRVWNAGAGLYADLYGRSETNPTSGRKYSYGYANGYLSGFWLYDSENLGLQLNANTGFMASLSDHDDRRNDPDQHGTYDSQSRTIRPRYTLSTNAIYFPGRMPLGLEWGGRGTIETFHGWGHDEYENTDSLAFVSEVSDHEGNANRYEVEGDIGIGWGRVRDATGLYLAFVLEERLREIGRLTGELSDDTRRKLADLYTTRSDYYRLYSRSDRYFWQDVEKVLTEDPAMTGPFDAYAAYRVAEYVAPYSISRWSGIRFSLRFQGMHSNSISRYTDHSFRRTETDTSVVVDALGYDSDSSIEHFEQFVVGPHLQANLPLSLRLQFTGVSALSRKIHQPDAGFIWRNELTLQYVLADRWYAYYEFDHFRWLRDPLDRNKDHGDSWFFGHSIGAEYFVENRYSLDFRIGHGQEYADNYRPYIPADPTFERIDKNFSARIGFSFNFRGSNNSSGYYTSTQPRTGATYPRGWYPHLYNYNW